MQDFAPFIPELLGAFSSPRPLAIKGTDDTAKVGVKHQSINYLPPKNNILVHVLLMTYFLYVLVGKINSSQNTFVIVYYLFVIMQTIKC